MYALVPTSNTSYYAMQSSFDAQSKMMLSIFVVGALIVLAIFLVAWIQSSRLKMLELQMELMKQGGDGSGGSKEEALNQVPDYAKPAANPTTTKQNSEAPMSAVGALPVAPLATPPVSATPQVNVASADIMSHDDAIHETFPSHQDEELEWIAEQYLGNGAKPS